MKKLSHGNFTVGKSFSALAITAALLAATGCQSGDQSSQESTSTPAETTTAATTPAETTAQTNAEAAAAATAESDAESALGEATVFTGPDGNVIYSNEVTEIVSETAADKTAAELTKTDYSTTVYCDGFQYFHEPLGTTYNNYDNPEMFDEILYTGDALTNENGCKRVNVGDTICGLTLTKATSEFKIENYEDMPDPFYYEHLEYDGSSAVAAEFSGSITLKGFLGVNPRNYYEPDGGTLFFTPTESKLPIMGSTADIYEHTNFVGQDYSVYSDSPSVQCGRLQELSFTVSGLDIGDMAYAEVTLTNLKYHDGATVVADVESITLLSDVLYHEDDQF